MMAVGPVDLRARDFGRVNPTHSSERWLHALILLAAVAVPLLGSSLTILGGERVALAGFERYPLPTLCASRWFGVQCPTCGLTRSTIELMHGHFASSLAHHRMGWLILSFLALQIPYRAARLLRPARRWPRLERWGIAMLLLIGIAVVVNRMAEVFLAS